MLIIYVSCNWPFERSTYPYKVSHANICHVFILNNKKTDTTGSVHQQVDVLVT